MNAHGQYGDTQDSFRLPDDWKPAGPDVLGTAVEKAVAALSHDDALDDLARYYDRLSSYAGTLFLDVQPNDPHTIEAADLYAVTTLSITLDARHGRLLLDEGESRSTVQRQLEGLPDDLTITDLERGAGGSAETLARMYSLYRGLRDLLPGNSSRWVTAAKLCARKRPRLFPVRDNLVCRYLGDGRELKRGDGWPGDFPIDIQVFAHLMTSNAVVGELDRLRSGLRWQSVRVDEEDLRLLDSALWMAAGRTAG